MAGGGWVHAATGSIFASFLRAKRSKSGAISFDLLEVEDSRAALQ